MSTSGMLFRLAADMAHDSLSPESLASNYDRRHRACQFGRLIDTIGHLKVCTIGF